MQILLSPSHNPYFNIACEEYLIKNSVDEILFLYRNEPSVIVGKHQNAFSEINAVLAKAHNIKIVRRLSGGGSVYHDLGNLNYTHIKNASGDHRVNFTVFLAPLIEALNQLGIPAEMGPRHNLQLNEKKITGTACHTIKKRVMHHGTLLIDADLNRLVEILTPINQKFESKAVKSISSTVTNIFKEFPFKGKLEEFITLLYQQLKQNLKATPFLLSEKHTEAIEEIMETKYMQWEWNYGYSPKFIFQMKKAKETETINIHVEKGMIKQIDHSEILAKKWVGEKFDALNFLV